MQAQGITIRKKTPDILNIISFYSPDGRYDDIYLSNFAQIHVYDELLRIDGVSQINFVGVGNYSMRAWLDPQKLASLNMTATDVANALQSSEPGGGLAECWASSPRRGSKPSSCPSTRSVNSPRPSSSANIIVKAVREPAVLADQCARHPLGGEHRLAIAPGSGSSSTGVTITSRSDRRRRSPDLRHSGTASSSGTTQHGWPIRLAAVPTRP